MDTRPSLVSPLQTRLRDGYVQNQNTIWRPVFGAANQAYEWLQSLVDKLKCMRLRVQVQHLANLVLALCTLVPACLAKQGFSEAANAVSIAGGCIAIFIFLLQIVSVEHSTQPAQ